MKKYYSDNEALNKVLIEHGINLICNDKMEIEVSEEDAERIPSVVIEFAPAALHDYAIV